MSAPANCTGCCVVAEDEDEDDVGAPVAGSGGCDDEEDDDDDDESARASAGGERASESADKRQARARYAIVAGKNQTDDRADTVTGASKKSAF